MATILTYLESTYHNGFLPYGELLQITDILSSYDNINELEYE